MSDYQISRRLVLFGAFPAACGLAAAPRRTVGTLAELRAAAAAGPSDGAEADVADRDAGGRFRWDAGSTAADDGGLVIAPAGARRGRWLRQYAGAINARWFGASPSASATRNSAAFAAASAAIVRLGGTLLVPAGEYRVGAQELARRRGRRVAHAPFDIIRIEGCRRPVVVSGRGATLKAADGLRFGAFDPLTGATHRTRLPFYDRDFASEAYVMILVRGCAAPVRIEGFELDGNASKYVLGGEWGDTGRQMSATGIIVDANPGGVTIANVNSHDHGLDGVMVIHAGLTASSPRYPVTLSDVTCDRNARQGLSWVGGTELTAIRCRFSRTGKGRFASGPTAGVDIEAENSVCRNGRFIECKFVDNGGVGFLAGTGDVADVSLERCEFIGTTNWSAWPAKPGIVFRDCLFVGAIVNAFGSPDLRSATQFHRCRFHANPALSPTRAIFGNFLADLGGGARNVLFKECDFQALDTTKALPWSPADTRYQDCRFRQAGRLTSHTRGVFSGTNRFESAGQVDLWGSRFAGRVTVNGKAVS